MWFPKVGKPVQVITIDKKYDDVIIKNDRTYVFRGKQTTMFVKCFDDQSAKFVKALDEIIAANWFANEEQYQAKVNEAFAEQLQEAIALREATLHDQYQPFANLGKTKSYCNAVYLVSPAYWQIPMQKGKTYLHAIPREVAQKTS